MEKLSKDFLKDKEILFVGYSSRNKGFCNSVMNAFVKNGFRVYPMNTRTGEGFDVKVYKSFEELPKVPETAYILLNGVNVINAIKPLKQNGVKRVLFQNEKIAEKAVVELCRELGIDMAVGCPMMLYGSGLHRLHGFFAGIKR